MAEHTLKCWPNSYDAIADGRKRFEWRRDDRGFEQRRRIAMFIAEVRSQRDAEWRAALAGGREP